jgi:hypothetical protein
VVRPPLQARLLQTDSRWHVTESAESPVLGLCGVKLLGEALFGRGELRTDTSCAVSNGTSP